MPTRPGPTQEALISTGEAARRCGLSRHTVLRAARRGDLHPALRTPGGDLRFRPADVAAFADWLVPVQGPHHSPRRAAIAADRGERMRAEERVASGEARFRALIEWSSDLVRVLAPDTTLLYASPSHLHMLGYAPEDLLARRSILFIHPDDRQMAQDAFDAVIAQGGERQVILRMRHAEGGYRTLEAHLHNRLADPAVRGIVVNSRDITEREAAATALRASEERYRQVEQHAPIGLALVAPDGHWLRVNPALCALVGYSEEELLARSFQDITHPADLDTDMEYVRQMLRGEIATYQLEKRYLRKDGAQVWALLSVTLVRDAAGTPRYFISQIQDITERKRAEAALDEARRSAGRRAAAFAPLVQLGAAIAAERDPRALCRLALAQLADRFGYDLVSIYLREEESLRLQAQHGYDSVLDPLPIGDRGVAARTVRTGVTQVVPDTAADPDFLGAVPGIVAEICVPLLVGGRVMGILNVESRTPDLLDHETRELCELVAGQLAVTLENHALHQAERRRADRLAALQAVTAILAAARTPDAVARIVVEQGRKALEAAAAIVRLLTADGTCLELLAVEGFGEEDFQARARLPVHAQHPVCVAACTGLPLWCRVQAEFQAYFSAGDSSWHVASNLQGAAMLPLIVDERTTGVLGLSFATPQSFDQADRDFLLTLANATAQALERARLDAAERERARAAEELARLRAAQAAQAEAMATIASALSGTLDPEQLYALILDQAARLLPSDHASILLFEAGWATVAATWGSPTRTTSIGSFAAAWEQRVG